MVVAVIACERRRHALAQPLRTLDHRLEELTRARLDAQEVKGFENDARQPLRPKQSHPRRDDRAVTVAPKDRALDLQGFEPARHLDGGATMKVSRQRVEPPRTAIAAAVGNQDSIVIAERSDLRIEGVDFVAPAAMQEDERMAVTRFAVMNRRLAAVGDERR